MIMKDLHSADLYESSNDFSYLQVAEGVDSAFEMIPQADEVHSNIDTAVNA